jgi:hypothetical protein
MDGYIFFPLPQQNFFHSPFGIGFGWGIASRPFLYDFKLDDLLLPSSLLFEKSWEGKVFWDYMAKVHASKSATYARSFPFYRNSRFSVLKTHPCGWDKG